MSKNNNNHSQWCSETYDQMLLQAFGERRFDERAKILAQAEKTMLEEMPIIPLYFESICHLVAPRVEGWHANILDWHPLKFVTLK
jgi:ABC-type oligopeptide transport system substrate-binding subunit